MILGRRRFEVNSLLFLTAVAHRKALVFLTERFDVGSGDTLALTSTTVVMPQGYIQERQLIRMARRCEP